MAWVFVFNKINQQSGQVFCKKLAASMTQQWNPKIGIDSYPPSQYGPKIPLNCNHRC